MDTQPGTREISRIIMTDAKFEGKLIALAASAAQAAVDAGDGFVPETVEEVNEGAPFVIDLLLPTAMESGDGRILLKDALTVRDLPIPLLWQPSTGSGHDGSWIVGRIDSCDVTEKGIENARGVFDTGPYGREAERLVRNNFLRGVSADLDKFKDVDEEELIALAEVSGADLSDKLIIKEARVMAGTLVSKPAFMECTIRIDDPLQEEEPLVDGIHESEVDYRDDSESIVASLIASAIPVTPPKEWFGRPVLKGPTPLNVDEDGRVYGHIATWSQDHIGYGGRRVKPPRNRSGYKYFHTGVVRTQEGTDVTVGQLTLAGGHAAMDLGASDAQRHYDDTGSAVADIHIGEDAFGIWVAGALRPGVTPEQVRVLRASAPSGDWRPLNNKLELVAICQVNVPGFPTVRSMVAGGQIQALVAAGAGDLFRMKHESTNALAERVYTLEQKELLKQKAELSTIFLEERARKQASLEETMLALKEQFLPELKAKREEREALFAQAEELKAAFRGPYKEELHPRDRAGRWREVLLRLSEVKDASPKAVEAVERAAEAEESGDDAAADAAGQEAEEALQESSRKIVNREDTGLKARLQEAEDLVRATITGAKPEGGSSALEEAVTAVLADLIDELGENVDPQRIVNAAFERLKQYVDGSHFESPEELTRYIANVLEKMVLKPDIAQ
jgi:hypothetical protein